MGGEEGRGEGSVEAVVVVWWCEVVDQGLRRLWDCGLRTLDCGSVAPIAFTGSSRPQPPLPPARTDSHGGDTLHRLAGSVASLNPARTSWRVRSVHIMANRPPGA